MAHTRNLTYACFDHNADDTVIYFYHKDPHTCTVQTTLNKELFILDGWMCKNKLRVDYDKTVSMLIGNRHMLKKCNRLDLSIKDHKINQVESLKYLGLYIDAELK